MMEYREAKTEVRKKNEWREKYKLIVRKKNIGKKYKRQTNKQKKVGKFLWRIFFVPFQ